MPDSHPIGKSPCPACDRIDRFRNGTSDHLFICDLGATLVFLHAHQPYEGWCVLFLKEHCEHLADLSPDRQVAIFRDVMNVAAAVRALFAPQRINYECLGNQLSHVHWHVIPRYQRPVDPDPGQVVWLRPAAELSAPLERGHAAMLVERLRAGLSPVNRR